MKNKIKILYSVVLLLLGSSALFSCTEGDNFEWNNRGLFVSGTENNPLVKFIVEDTPVSYSVTVQSTKPVDSDVNIRLAIDPDAVTRYNVTNGTNYCAVPESAVELDNADVTISAGAAISSVATAKIISTEDMVEGRTYVVPISVESYSGTSDPIIESSKTIFLRISRTMNFYAIQADAAASSNYVFQEDQSIKLTQFTYEVKVYPQGLSNKGPERFLVLGGVNNKHMLLRFNEANTQNKLQTRLCVDEGGAQFISATQFQNNQWYMLSWVYDGSTISFYVNGVLDTSVKANIQVPIDFRRYEMGMSWGGLAWSQFFSHRFCELRIWNRALSSTEIINGTCGVDPHSEGLAAYWKFNEGQGSIFHDATGGGRDMDWAKSQDIDDNKFTPTPNRANYINWVKDDINKCAQ